MTEAAKVSASAPVSDTTNECADGPAHRVARLFGRLDLRARTALLSRLLAFIGPLALAVVGQGLFRKYVPYARRSEVPVSSHDAAQATPTVIAELVRYVRQSNPRELERMIQCVPHDAIARACAGYPRKP